MGFICCNVIYTTGITRKSYLSKFSSLILYESSTCFACPFGFKKPTASYPLRLLGISSSTSNVVLCSSWMLYQTSVFYLKVPSYLIAVSYVPVRFSNHRWLENYFKAVLKLAVSTFENSTREATALSCGSHIKP